MAEYKIECYTKFSWGYVYVADERRCEIWAESLDDLKRKVLERNLPWDDANAPQAKRSTSDAHMWA